MSERRGTEPGGATRLADVPTETRHGRTPALDRPARTPSTPPPPGDRPLDQRTPEQIERDIAVTRERLANTIDEISERVKPANVARNAKTSLLAQVRAGDGSWRYERIGAVAAVVAAYIAVKLVRRRRHR